MSTLLGPLAELERDLGMIVARDDLTPAAKLTKLRVLRDEFQSLLTLAEQYIGDTELLREAEASDLTEALFRVRENAYIREELLKRGMADPEDLDELGYLSYAELDRLKEEGRLLEWAGVLQEANLVFDPRLHPRDRLGKFRDVLGGLSAGKSVAMPHGVNVSKQEGGGYVVKHKSLPGGQIGAPSARAAAERALSHFDQQGVPRPPSIPKVPVKGRAGGKVPDDVHGPPASQMEHEAMHKGADEGEFVDVGGDIELAAKLLSEGKKVRLDQPREVSTLLDKLAEVANDMKAKGEKAPDFDLCRVSVKGTNLFCVESKGIPRNKMPQLVGDPAPGSKADALPRNSRGEVDVTDQFRQHLKDMGVEIEPGHEQASYLRASQSELNGVKTAGIMGAIEGGVVIEGSLFVSRDNYIVDGHHRWAAEVGRDLRDNVEGDITMQVERIDMDIGTLLDEANAFAEEWGLQQQAVGESAGIARQESGFKQVLYMDDFKPGAAEALGEVLEERHPELAAKVRAEGSVGYLDKESANIGSHDMSEIRSRLMDRGHDDLGSAFEHTLQSSEKAAAQAAPGAGKPEAGKRVTPETALGTAWEPQLDDPNPPDIYTEDEIEAVSLTTASDEEVQRVLAAAKEHGLNEWPEKDELASKILGEAENTLELHTSGGQTTVGKTADGHPDFTEARRIYHDRIIDVLKRRRRKVVGADGKERQVLDPNGPYLKPPPEGEDPVALFMGGGTASGKTTALNLPENENEIPEDSVIVDVDEIKSMMAEYHDMVIGGSKYAAVAVHQESLAIGARLVQEAMQDGLHVVLDGTGDTPVQPGGADQKILNRMREFTGDGNTNKHGGPAYKVHGFYVSADTDVAVIRAARRAMQSGRWVPEPTIREIHMGVSQRFEKDVMQAIEEGVITKLKGYDSTDLNNPREMFGLDDEGKLLKVDEELFDKFLGKRNESA